LSAQPASSRDKSHRSKGELQELLAEWSHFFDPAGRGEALLLLWGASGDTGGAALDLSCFGFFCSRLLRF
jgi:hypothetical protein